MSNHVLSFGGIFKGVGVLPRQSKEQKSLKMGDVGAGFGVCGVW